MRTKQTKEVQRTHLYQHHAGLDRFFQGTVGAGSSCGACKRLGDGSAMAALCQQIARLQGTFNNGINMRRKCACQQWQQQVAAVRLKIA